MFVGGMCACVGGGVQMRGNGCSVIQKTMVDVELYLISLFVFRLRSVACSQRPHVCHNL